jgi:phosphate transport system ATP-binding protein
MGPSGCGKSTFIRCINRMHDLTPGFRTEGEILYGGEDIHASKIDPVALRRRIGMVFQQPNPFPRMSVFENVAVGLKLNGTTKGKREIAARVEQSLRMAALWDEVKDHLSRPGMSLSGGQQQRLCIARALAVEPEILLMDEPCSALDPVSTGKIEELIEDLGEKYTIVIVTHNMQQAARVSDFVAFFLMGDLVELDRSAKIFTNPSDKRTEEYITGRYG